MTRRAFSVAVFVLNRAARYPDVLLIHHKRFSLWLPVGGEVEEGETPIEAAKREVWEETKLEIEFPVVRGALSGEPLGFLGYEEHPAGSKGLHLNFNFVALSRSREIVGDDSFTEHVWHPLGDIFVDKAPDNVKQCLSRIHAMRHDGRIRL